MRSTWLSVFAVLGACASDVPVGTVDVSYFQSDGTPVANAVLASDTSPVTTRTDANGHAVLQGIEAGATLYAINDCEQCGGAFITGISNVEPGETIVLGEPPTEPAAAPIGTMTIDYASAPSEAFSHVQVTSTCGTAMLGATSATLQLDERCAGTVDVLVQQIRRLSMSSFELSAYTFVSTPFVDGGAITIQASQWTTPAKVELTVTGPLTIAQATATLTNGLASVQGGGAGTMLGFGKFARIGRPMIVSVDAAISGGGRQNFAAVLSPTADTLDGARLFAPWIKVTDASASAVTYAVDDAGGVLLPFQLLDTTFAWQVGSRNNLFRYLVDPTTVNGELVTPELPEPVRGYRPSDGGSFLFAYAHRFDEGVTYAQAHQTPDRMPGGDAQFTHRSTSSGR